MTKIPNELALPQSIEVNVERFAQMIHLLKEQEKQSVQNVEKGVVQKTAIGVMDPMFQKEIIGLITNLWRTKTRIIDSKSREPREDLKKEDVRKIARYLESMFEGIKNMGFEVKDRTDEPFSYGMTENVIASQVQEGITQEIIIETLKPTIYWKNQIAQQGEVVIATPITENK
jgi:hypothetical protein